MRKIQTKICLGGSKVVDFEDIFPRLGYRALQNNIIE